MAAGFNIGAQDLLIWALIGLLGGLLGGLIVRTGSMKLSDAIWGVLGALLGGVATELVGMRRELTEGVAALAAAFFMAVVLTILVRLIPGRFAA